MDLTFEIKEWFFDRAQLLAAVDKATARNLSASGAAVRRRARGSIKFRLGPSDPYNPPHAHTRGTASLRTIWFAFEPDKATVLVGPIRLARDPVDPELESDDPAPQTQEFGGMVLVRQVRAADGSWRRLPTGRFGSRTSVLRYGREQRIAPARVEPRPFMRPALDAEAAGNAMIRQWQDTIAV